MLAGFIVAVAIVSLLGVIKMTKRLIHPISELSEATKAITNEDFTYSLDIHRKDELGQLAENFLRMRRRRDIMTSPGSPSSATCLMIFNLH